MLKLANNLSAFNDFSSGPYFSECGLQVFCNAQWIYFHELQSSLVNFYNLPCPLVRTFTSDPPVMGRREWDSPSQWEVSAHWLSVLSSTLMGTHNGSTEQNSSEVWWWCRCWWIYTKGSPSAWETWEKKAWKRLLRWHWHVGRTNLMGFLEGDGTHGSLRLCQNEGSVNIVLKKSSEEQYRVTLSLKYKTKQIPLGQEEI